VSGEAPPPFLILALPRSRTYWLSRFLSYGPWSCEHDQLRHLRSWEDLATWWTIPFNGSVETNGMTFWRLIPPHVRVVTIRRPVDEVLESLLHLGLPFDQQILRLGLARMDQKLDQLEARRPGVLSLQYHCLQSESICRELFEHCLGLEHDSNWWLALAKMNLQTNLQTTLKYLSAFQPQLERLALLAKQRQLTMLQWRAPRSTTVTFQQESLSQFISDGQQLFAEHAAAVGEAADSYQYKNIPEMQRLEDEGNLLITTARSNGRMFGYLMAQLGPSLEDPLVRIAAHGLFYTSSHIPRLGLKLQRASVVALRERGVSKIHLGTGQRAQGDRLDILYRRLGAEEYSRMFVLDTRSLPSWV
jgi:hypothetical protein